MIKTYQTKSINQQAKVDDWGEVWQGQELSEKYIGSIAWDGYTEVLSRYLPDQALVLEAGCGLGKYVIYLKRNGHRVIGIDLEGQALRRTQAYEPGLVLNFADVTSLPFKTGAFDVYISLGVIEHFEAGPNRALSEARRVLRQGGLAFISVPYQHLLKDLGLRLTPNELHNFVAGFTLEEAASGEKQFYQYAFTKQEITREIRAAGFRVLAAHPCCRLHWFLHRSPVRQLRTRLRPLNPSRDAQLGVTKTYEPFPHKRPSRALELVPLLQRLIPGWLAGHMVMVVARRE